MNDAAFLCFCDSDGKMSNFLLRNTNAVSKILNKENPIS